MQTNFFYILTIFRGWLIILIFFCNNKLFFKGFKPSLPSNTFVIVRVEVCECPGPEIRASVGGFQRVTTRDSHAPEDDPSCGLLLTLDSESTFGKIR